MPVNRIPGLLALLLLALALGACAATQPRQLATAAPAGAQPAPALARALPALAALEGPGGSRAASAVLSHTGAEFASSSNVTTQDTSAVFGNDETKLSWAVYSFDTTPSSVITSLDLAYSADAGATVYAAVADYGAQVWRFFPLSAPAGNVSLAALASLVSPAQHTYVAVLAYGGSAMSITTLTLGTLAAVDPDWIHSYGRENSITQTLGEWVNGMQLDGSGNLYAAARCYPLEGSFTTLDRDVMLLKYSGDGTLGFAEVYHCDDTTYATDMLLDKDGNMVVCGGDWVGKFDSSGALLWSKRYSSLNLSSHEFQQLDTDATGALYVAGFSDDWEHAGVLKLDKDGAVLWAKRWTIANNLGDIEYPQLNMCLSGGKLYIVDREEPSSNLSNLLHEIDAADGTLLGVKTWQNDFDYAYKTVSLLPQADGILLAGQDSGFKDNFFYTSHELLWIDSNLTLTKSAAVRYPVDNSYLESQCGLAQGPGGDIYILATSNADTHAGLRLLHCSSEGAPLGAFELQDGMGNNAAFATGISQGLLVDASGVYIGGMCNNVSSAHFQPFALSAFTVAPSLSDSLIHVLTDLDFAGSDVVGATLTEGSAAGCLPDRGTGNYDAMLLRAQF